MLSHYPDIKPFRTQMLNVDKRHQLYVEQSGNPDGLPVLFVHGGPGAGSSKQDRCFFDPEKYHIILFDQRGAGRSQPHADLTDNTTEHLVNDMEAIRIALGIEKWVLFGGSWGSTLSLIYAETHPDRVLGLILRGIFLCSKEDIDWFYQSGASRIFPDYWEDYLHPIPAEEHGDLLEAYYQRLTGSNDLAQMACAKAWSLWEARCATLRPNPDLVDAFTDPHTALALARIEAHYFKYSAFMQINHIVKNARRLEGIPGVIIHGRYDMVCPLDNAFALHQAWPEAELHIIRDAGHSAREPSIIDALIRATRTMARRFGDGPLEQA